MCLYGCLECSSFVCICLYPYGPQLKAIHEVFPITEWLKSEFKAPQSITWRIRNERTRDYNSSIEIKFPVYKRFSNTKEHRTPTHTHPPRYVGNLHCKPITIGDCRINTHTRIGESARYFSRSTFTHVASKMAECTSQTILSALSISAMVRSNASNVRC